jgi:subtilisin family serine protease
MSEALPVEDGQAAAAEETILPPEEEAEREEGPEEGAAEDGEAELPEESPAADEEEPEDEIPAESEEDLRDGELPAESGEEPDEEEPEEPRAPRRPRDPERGRKILRWIGGILTALGLLILLAAALFLLDLHRQQRAARSAVDEDAPAIQPVRPGIINYTTQPAPDRVRSEGGVCYVSDELIVVSAEGVPYTDMERFFGERSIRVVGYVELTDAYQIRLGEEHSFYGLTRIAEELEAEEQVDCAVLNVLWEPAGYTLPADPWDGSADWESMSAQAGNWGLLAIRAPESWERYPASGVRVGLIDSAFDPAHEDLRYTLLRGNESYGRTTEEIGEDYRQHGTAVAGVIAAVHDNDLGLAGALRDCRLYAWGSAPLCGQMEALSALAELALQGVPVTQYSLGWQESLQEEILREDSRARHCYSEEPARAAGLALERLLGKGYDFLLVLPAGNGLNGQGTDARYSSVFAAVDREPVRQHILVVGAAALDGEGRLSQAAFSGLGERVDLLAPGAEIYTALPGDGYGRRSGTSLAAAYVTALCAKAWSLNPGLSGRELRDLAVETGADRVPGGSAPLADMEAALERAVRTVKEEPGRSEEEQALDAYAQLLREGVLLRGRSTGILLKAQRYILLDMDENGVPELLVYALDENESSASFALYGFRDGNLVSLGNAWDTCRYASWSNMSLSLEICDGKYVYAGARKNSEGYGETGEDFWLRYNGKSLNCTGKDRRKADTERIVLIRESELTDEGVRIGSARDSLWGR